MIARNLVANYFGQGWVALMGLAFVPWYVELVGVESYALIGVMASIQAVSIVFDLGLSQSLNRELARLSVINQYQKMANTARTLEVIYWVMAIVVLLALVSISEYLATQWLNPGSITGDTMQNILYMIAIIIAIRWPISIYAGGFNGLQRQVELNVWQVVFSSLQSIGALLVLIYIEATVINYFIWQIIVVTIQVIVMKIRFWFLFDNLEIRKPVFEGRIIKNILNFTAGITGISIVSIILMQADKIVLSKVLSLQDFGYYTLATVIASVVSRLVAPIMTVYYPKISSIVALDDERLLSNKYHEGCQLMSIIVLPCAIGALFYSNEILTLWIVNDVIVNEVVPIVVLLVIGNSLNGLATLPYILQLAYGWTSLALYTDLFLSMVIFPVMYMVAVNYGGVGAALVWIGSGLLSIVITVIIMHRRLLKNQMNEWFIRDILYILSTIVIIFWLSSLVDRGGWNEYLELSMIIATGIMAVIVGVLSSNQLRPKLISMIRHVYA